MKGIASLNGVEIGQFYTTDGKDIWEVESYCESPTITLKNVKTEARCGGGVGCLNLSKFQKLVIEV